MLLLTFFLAPAVLLLPETCYADNMNYRPIIGIMAEEGYSHLVPNATSVIWASYVKYIESGGARVVPILIRQPRQYYEDLLQNINGVLFPGGGDILQSDGYGKTGKIIFDIAVKMNDRGDFFPLWGTCLGFQLLNFLAVDKLWMKRCSAEDLATNIGFVKDYGKGNMFRYADPTLLKTMQVKKVAIHYHHWCLTPENYTISGLNKYFRVLALNQDKDNVTFISAVEGYKYPFYGVAFHPEKVVYEWIDTKTRRNTPHTNKAVKTSQYLADFFVDLTRYNNHTFPSREAELKALIYNYDPVFTGVEPDYPSYQSYLFS